MKTNYQKMTLIQLFLEILMNKNMLNKYLEFCSLFIFYFTSDKTTDTKLQ